MKTITSMFIVLSTIVIISHSCKNDHIWSEESNRVHREVKTTLGNYYKDVNENGFEAEFKYLDSTSQFSWFPPGFNSAISFDSVRNILKRNVLLYPYVHLEWDSLNVIPESGTKASYAGKITGIMQDTTGHRDTFHLSEIGVMIKKEDGWKLLSGKTVVIDQ